MSPRALRVVVWGFLAVALLGFLDASYLTIKHYAQSSVTCGLTQGCEIVTTSAYSQILGVPVALLGSLYYLTLIVLLIAYMDRKHAWLLRTASLFTCLGLLASVYFVSVQAFVLGAWCQYCIGSALSSTLLFGIGMSLHYSRKKLV